LHDLQQWLFQGCDQLPSLLNLQFWYLPKCALHSDSRYPMHIVLDLRLWHLPIRCLHFYFQHRVLHLRNLRLWPVRLYCLRWN
jgi:hypothetical protein